MTRRYRMLVVAAALSLAAACSAVRAQDKASDLLAGAKWAYSTDGGSTFKAAADVPAGQTVNVTAKATFQVADPAALGGLKVAAEKGASATINGKSPSGPLRGMKYGSLTLDPVAMLVKGENVLLVQGVAGGGKPDVRLMSDPPSAVAIQSGPILGAIGEDYFTLTCRTNMAATVTVSAKPVDPAGAEVSATSTRGFYHRLRLSLPKGTAKFSYTATAQCASAKKTLPAIEVAVPGAGGALRFAATGDCRSNPRGWKSITEGMAKFNPQLMLFSGDLVSSGRIDELWDREFVGPAQSFLDRVPTLPVVGNHENEAPAFFELFYTPDGKDGRGHNWSETVGGVQFIGIDGSEKGDVLPKFLESVLADSKAKFIFLTTHYPAYSSGPHGSIRGSQALMPVLVKYHVTAMIAGHDHDYERSEPPADKGITCIVAGGAGAPSYTKKKSNPYSKIFVTGLSFCIFDIKGDTCQMKAYNPGGKVIDEKTFTARQGS